jgi:hypothetical protein
MMNNFWLGPEEFTIAFMNGTHVVLSSWEEKPIFTGTYAMCVKYCEELITKYKETFNN